MKVLSYLTYAGGFDVGFDQAGIKTTHHLHDGYAQKTYDMNWPEVSSTEWLKGFEDESFNLIYANPPCACWSINGKQLGLADPRAADTLRLAGLAEQYNPKILITESVIPAMKFFEEDFALTFRALGYSTKIVLVNAKWHGMIQDRKRMFFIASKVGISIPAPNWSPPKTVREGLEALSAPVEPSPEATRPLEIRAVGGRLSDVRPGESLAKAWERLVGGPDELLWERNSKGHVKGRPPFCSYRLHPDKSSRAFTGYYAYVHPYHDRWLTMREIKEGLCEFPRNYMFHEQHIGEQMKEMSRGVMPPVARWLGGYIKTALDMSIPTVVDHKVIDYREAPNPL